MNRRERIKGTIEDVISDFLYYDRKEDEDLPRGAIDEAIAEGEVTTDEIITWFACELRKRLT